MRSDSISLLKELCSMPSQSSNRAGVQRYQEKIASLLETIGPFKLKHYQNPLYAPLLEGTYRGSDKKISVALVSHADTVDGFHESIQIKGQQAVGQGVLDDKACQVVALLGLKLFFKKFPRPKLNLYFVSSSCEEHGSPGFHTYYQKLSKKIDLALGFEPSTEQGDIISSRKGNRWYQVTVTGREAHAGRDYLQGVNAGVELAHKISAVEKLSDVSKGVTFSLGSLQSSKNVFNVVCGDASAKFDFRFCSVKQRDEFHKKFMKIMNRVHLNQHPAGLMPSTQIKILDDCPAFLETRQAKKYVSLYLDCIYKISGRLQKSTAVGGAADISHMSRPGIALIDGLGATGGRMHHKDEWVNLNSINERAQALALFLENLEVHT